MSDVKEFIPQLTGDGTFTFISPEFGEAFHSHHGAKQESFLKFVVPTQLAHLAKKPRLQLLDICYGLGYNTAAALQTIWEINPDCNVELRALEIDPRVPQAAINQKLFANWDANWDYKYTEILSQLAFESQVETNHLQAKLLIGDARKSIQMVYQSGFLADAIFLDPFSPPQCPQLWTIEFIQYVASCLHPDGLLATYSCAAAVRIALLEAGLIISSTHPVGRRTPGTLAAHRKTSSEEFFSHLSFPPLALSPSEQEHLFTRAAIPYRDPDLSDSKEAILIRRNQEQSISPLEPTSHWRKRWIADII
jgi:tRNA U34 5-methylaminomethyl-2-thiouridine-forming methyltransferase MnmC